MCSLFSSLSLSLKNFEGPLEILVHLVQRREIKVEEVSLKEVFCRTLQEEALDIESAPFFLDYFTLLLLIKSRLCLFLEQGAEEEVFERPEEMLKHLADYYHVKEMVLFLQKRDEEEALCFLRGASESLLNKPPASGIEQISLEELQSLFQKVLKQIPENRLCIQRDLYSVQDGKKIILNGLAEKGVLDLYPFLKGIATRSLLIVVFLALLELMKEGAVSVSPNFLLTLLN